MPRKSANALAPVVTPLAPRRIKPPANSGLDEGERLLFSEIVDSLPAGHFTQSDSHLLCSYVQGLTLSRLCYDAVLDDPAQLGAWERTTRTLASLAGKLRLAPISRMHPRTVAHGIDAMRDPRGWEPRA